MKDDDICTNLNRMLS